MKTIERETMKGAMDMLREAAKQLRLKGDDAHALLCDIHAATCDQVLKADA